MQRLLVGLLSAVSVFAILGAVYLLRDNARLNEALAQAQAQSQQVSERAELPPMPMPTASTTAQARPARTPAPMTTTDAQVTELQTLLESKERQIERLRQELAAKPQVEQVVVQAPQEERRRGRGFDMERLREEDPERYEEIRERMRRFIESVQESAGQQSDFLLQLDTANLNEEAKVQLESLQENLRALDDISARIAAAEQSGESTRDLRREMGETMREMRPLMQTARQAALADLATQMGYTAQSAPEFVEYIDYLLEMTSPTSFWRRNRGGGGGGGDRTEGNSNNR